MAPAPPTAVSRGSIHRTGFGGALVQETPTKRLLSHPALLARISSAALNLQSSLENSPPVTLSTQVLLGFVFLLACEEKESFTTTRAKPLGFFQAASKESLCSTKVTCRSRVLQSSCLLQGTSKRPKRRRGYDAKENQVRPANAVKGSNGKISLHGHFRRA